MKNGWRHYNVLFPTPSQLNAMNCQPRDFIETAEGLVFAVVDGVPEDGKVLGFLRYAASGKVSTAAANALLREQHPHYLHRSKRLDARLHAVPFAHVRRHHRPRQRVQELLAQGAADAIEAKLLALLRLLIAAGTPPECLGVTGSVLIHRQHPASDLDVVVYGREHFFHARESVQALIAAGRLQGLDGEAWRDAYARRGCALDFETFLRHEQRKGNKGMIAGAKFDLALIAEDDPPEPQAAWGKIGAAKIQARVADASRAFDQPARYRIEHPDIHEIQCHTHTYAGQACAGEWIEAAGQVEQSAGGDRRLVVGSSREAPGEYIRVLGL
jgi:predicted nucleotidyltransferase